MKNFETVLQQVKTFPTEPGCYLMKDSQGRIFYVGKAINLRNRIKSYFSGQDKRTFVSFLQAILTSIETIVVRNETEALILERTLINKYKPRFNIHLKDDKNFILLRLNVKKAPHDAEKHLKYPKLELTRKAKKDGAKYFGPYPNANKLRETLHLINKHFQLRTCSDKVINNRTRPCVQFQIGRCPAPCVKEVPDYAQETENIACFLSGRTDLLEKRLKVQMWHASESENFELAQKIRDQIDAIQTSMIKQAASQTNKNISEDVFALEREGHLLEISLLQIRQGNIVQNSSNSFDRQEFPSDELLLSFLNQYYENVADEDLPNQILTSISLSKEVSLLAESLSDRKAKKVTIHKPVRGKSKALVEIAKKNAQVKLKERLEDEATQTATLKNLQKLLGLKKIPLKIECFDISLFQGTDAVASQVVFENGQPVKKLYRKYNIKSVEGMNDFAMMYEVVKRRLKKGSADKHLPDLILVDGGKGQLSSALAAAKDLDLEVSKNSLFIAGITKARTQKEADNSISAPLDDIEPFDQMKRSSERLFLPNVKDPIPLKTHSAERYLIERIRDEAHRFAVTFHRSKRSKRTLSSVLEDVPSIGKHRLKMLLSHFGSVEKIKVATVEEIAKLPGISEKIAKHILSLLS